MKRAISFIHRYYIVHYLVFIICSVLILSGLSFSSVADVKDSKGNASPMIFNFSAASPVKESQLIFTLNKTSQYSKNDSVEAYYNNLSHEADTTLLKAVFLGIPMECHFCMTIPITRITG